jgi:hypothetical protein
MLLADILRTCLCCFFTPRFQVLNQYAQDTAAALSNQAYEIEDMFQHTRGQFDLVMSVARGEAPPAAPAVPAGVPMAAATAPVVAASAAPGPIGGSRPLQPGGVLGGQPLPLPGGVGGVLVPGGPAGVVGGTSRAPGGPVKTTTPGAPLVGGPGPVAPVLAPP